MTQRWMLITGCSTGIGRALVYEARNRGWGVVATARRVESIADLPKGKDLRALSLDVTDPQSILEAVRACQDLELQALVNNAGYGQMGPLEFVTPEELRRQLETNVVGLHGVTQAFLSKLKDSGRGRIVQIASVLGRLSIPMAGPYNASKHAVIALAETLRLEVSPDIRVILVEPGAIRTEFRKTLVKAWGDLPTRVHGTRYERLLKEYQTRRENFGEKHGLTAESCARRILKALEARNPPRRVVIGLDARASMWAKALLPSWLWEWGVRRAFGMTD